MFTYFWSFLELFIEKFILNINNEHAQDYSCPGATFAFCSHGEKLPRQGGWPGVVQRVTRLSKLPRGNEKLMWTVTGVRPCTEAKLTPGSVSCPGAMSCPGIMWTGPKTQCFIEHQLKRNNKEVIAYLRDKHFECCIFNIVKHHQTFVNKDWNREVLLHWHRKKEMFHKALCYSLARPSLFAENYCKTIFCKYKRPLWHISCINVVNTSLLIARIKLMWW